MSKAKRFPAPLQALPSKPEPGRGRTLPDLPERSGSQAFIRASEIRYRRLFEAARDGILIVDPTTRKITDANPFMTELLGYPHKELVGKELWEIGLLEDEKSSQAAFRELQNKHFIRYEDLPLQNKAGQRHEVEFVTIFMRRTAGKSSNATSVTSRNASGLSESCGMPRISSAGMPANWRDWSMNAPLSFAKP